MVNFGVFYNLFLPSILLSLQYILPDETMKQYDTKVSIILPVYNAGKYLASCLESLVRQSYKDIEIIAIDDFSKDESYKILKQYRRKDTRIKVFRNKKRYGLAVCFNRAVKMARGRFITFMNPHDTSSIYRIKKQVTFLTDHPKIAAVGVQCKIVDTKDRKIAETSYPTDHESIFQHLMHGASMRFESVMLDRRILPKDLLYFTHNAYPYIYTNVMTKILQYGRIANLDQYLYYHREISAKTYKKLKGLDKTASAIKHWLQWIAATYDYRPSITAFFYSFLNPVKTMFR
jgi:glycosyltransferase involved in cell wall biosynthesis